MEGGHYLLPLVSSQKQDCLLDLPEPLKMTWTLIITIFIRKTWRLWNPACTSGSSLNLPLDAPCLVPHPPRNFSKRPGTHLKTPEASTMDPLEPLPSNRGTPESLIEYPSSVFKPSWSWLKSRCQASSPRQTYENNDWTSGMRPHEH